MAPVDRVTSLSVRVVDVMDLDSGSIYAAKL